ncbi:cell division protein FtsQ/DivIB [Brevibacillus ginsengisoli]|uniref:cell division protein FtsQ/DivIB n=1 Tax=Brevibacillus ginsengisoli TaxID=363854 RepID=UPI003CE92B9A
MSVYNERIPQVRQIPEQPKKKGSRRLLYLLFFFFLIILAVLFVRSPYSKISDIQVYGNTIYSSDEIIQASGLSKGMQFFNVWQKSVQANTSVLQGVKEITVTREFPGVIQLHVQEFNRVALVVQSPIKQFPLLENGKLLQEKNYSGKLIDRPIIRNWNSPDLLDQLGKQLALIPQSILSQISDIVLTQTAYDKQRITLYMKDGNQVQSVIYLLAKKIIWYPSVVKEIPQGEKGIIYMLESTWYSKYGSTQTPAQEGTGEEKGSSNL